MYGEIKRLVEKDWFEKTGHLAPQPGELIKFRATWIESKPVLEGKVGSLTMVMSDGRQDYTYHVYYGPKHGASIDTSNVVYDDTPPMAFEHFKAMHSTLSTCERIMSLPTRIFRAITPKLGGAGFTNELREELRQLAHLSAEEKAICDLDKVVLPNGATIPVPL